MQLLKVESVFLLDKYCIKMPQRQEGLLKGFGYFILCDLGLSWQIKK